MSCMWGVEGRCMHPLMNMLRNHMRSRLTKQLSSPQIYALARRALSQGSLVRKKDMATPSWNYEDQAAWGNVKGWEVATSGKRQSPINIDTRLVKTNTHLKPLLLQGWNNPYTGNIQNTGHSIQFTPATQDKILLTTHSGTYFLTQFHFHWGISSQKGSEHTIDDESYSAEIHFVHRKTSGPDDAGDALSVLGMLCKADEIMKISGTAWKHLIVPKGYHQTCQVDHVVFSDFLPPDLDYYHYEGSLTTPPCSEIVMWYLFKQPIKIPTEFLSLLRQINDENNQPLLHNHRHPRLSHNCLVQTPEGGKAA